MTDFFVTIFAIFAPPVALILYVAVRHRLRRGKDPAEGAQIPPSSAKPYVPNPTTAPNAFLRLFAPKVQFYLRQQWSLALFGFLYCTVVFTLMLCGSFLPSAVSDHYLPTLQQRVWFSFLTQVGVWSFIPIFCAIIAVMITCSTLVMQPAVFYRTRPISLRWLFWARVLSAIASLMLAVTVSIGISVTVLRLTYGPVWKSAPYADSAAASARHQKLINLDEDETEQQAVQRRLNWLGSNVPAPRFASVVTSTVLVFSIMMVILCQPFGAKRSVPKFGWVGAVLGMTLYYIGKELFSVPTLRFLFYSGPFDPAPSWRYLPIPLVLSAALLLIAERFYLHREV